MYTDPTGMYSTAEWKKDNGITDDDVIEVYNASDEDTKSQSKNDDSERPEDWPTSPFSNTNYTLLYAEQEALKKYSQDAQKAKNARLKKTVPLSIQLLLATTHAVSVKISGGVSILASIGEASEAILILAGKYAGTLVILSSESKGIGLASINLTLSGTIYTYIGDMENFNPERFAGVSAQGSASIGVFGAGLSCATDKYGGKLYGRSLSIGLEMTPLPVNANLEIEKAKIERIVYLK